MNIDKERTAIGREADTSELTLRERVAGEILNLAFGIKESDILVGLTILGHVDIAPRSNADIVGHIQDIRVIGLRDELKLLGRRCKLKDLPTLELALASLLGQGNAPQP